MAEWTTETALIHLQRSLVVPKDQWNDFSKFHYRNVESICAEAKRVMAEAGIDGSIMFDDEIYEICGKEYLRSVVRFKVVGDNEIQRTAYVRIPVQKKGMDDCQILGSASSYCRKYAASGLLAISDGKDPDGMDNRQKDEKKKEPPKKEPAGLDADTAAGLINQIVKLGNELETVEGLAGLWKDNMKEINRLPKGQLRDLTAWKDERKEELQAKP